MAFAILGFCKAEVKPKGPVHEYVEPPLDAKLMVVFKQTVGLFKGAITGKALIVTAVVEKPVQPLALVTVKVYVPAFVAVADAIIGF